MAKMSIKIIEMTAEEIETYFNDNLYPEGWEVVQVFAKDNKEYLLSKGLQ